MKIQIQQTLNTEVLLQDLKTQFPNYKVEYPPLNKKTIRIVNGLNQVVVGQLKDNRILCVGNINMTNPKILIPFILGMLLFLIGGIVFIVVMSQIKKKEYQAMEDEVGDYLKNTYLT
jgi:hypothetical protein